MKFRLDLDHNADPPSLAVIVDRKHVFMRFIPYRSCPISDSGNREASLAAQLRLEGAPPPPMEKRICAALHYSFSRLSAEHFTVDGTLIEAWASLKSFRPMGSAPHSGVRLIDARVHLVLLQQQVRHHRKSSPHLAGCSDIRS